MRALRAPSAPQADGQQSVQLPPPGDVLVCLAPWDASLGLRIFADDPGNRLMPTLTAGARFIRTLFTGRRLIPYYISADDRLEWSLLPKPAFVTGRIR